MSNTLSSYIKEMRKQFGLTQVDLAAKSALDSGSCESWNRARRRFALTK